MEIAVVGSPEFTLGFQLAGISTLYNPEGEEETSKVFRSFPSSRSSKPSPQSLSPDLEINLNLWVKAFKNRASFGRTD